MESRRSSTPSRTDGIYLWDKLAAVATLQPEMLQIERRTIVVDDDGATLDAPSGASVDVAVGADADAVTREFFRTLNGGVLPTIPDGSPEEHAYFDQLGAGLHEFASAGEAIYAETAGDAHTEAARFIVTVAEALEQLASVIDSVDPPAPLAWRRRITDGSLQLVAPDSSGQRWFWIGVSGWSGLLADGGSSGPIGGRDRLRQVQR